VTAREAEQHPERSRRDLRVHGRAGVGGADRLVHQLSPQIGRRSNLLERERHRHADRVGETAHPVDLDLGHSHCVAPEPEYPYEPDYADQ
jgi:hypothetical protein